MARQELSKHLWISMARAALYSLGFMMRRAAAVGLDIDERELKVGLRIVRDANGDVRGEIFISDSLENGAGYSSHLGTPAAAEDLLRFVAGQVDRASTHHWSHRNTRMRARLRALIAYGTLAILHFTIFSIGGWVLTWPVSLLIRMLPLISQFPIGKTSPPRLRLRISRRCRNGSP